MSSKRSSPAESRAPQRIALALAIFYLAAPRLLAQEPPRAKDRWLATDLQGLRVAGKVRAPVVSRVAMAVIETRAAVLSLLATPGHSSPLPTRVILFKTHSDLVAYSRDAYGAEPAAPLATARGRLGRTIAISADEMETALGGLREIVALDLLDELLPAAPRWLRTGLPPLLGGLQVSGTVATLAVAGKELGLPAFWPAASQLSTLDRAQLRPVAVAIVHYLLAPGSDRSAQFSRYLSLLRSSGPEALFFDEAFAGNLEQVNSEARSRGNRRGPAPSISLSSQPATAPPATALAYPEVLNLLGELLNEIAPWNTVAAELHYRQALESAPESAVAETAAAWRGIALVRDLDRRHTDALQMYDRSLALNPTDADTLTLAGWSRLEAFRRAVGTRRGWESQAPEPVAAARRNCGNALESAPGLAPALHCFGATFLYERSVPEKAAAALKEAHRLLPRNDEVLLDLILLHGHRGDFESAWRLYRGPLQRLAPPSSLSLAAKILVEDAMAHATDLVRSEDFSGAREVLDLTRLEVPDPQLDQAIAGLSGIEEGLRRDRLVTLHNRAAELMAERRWQEARGLLDTLLASDLPDDLLQSTRRMVQALPAGD